MNQAILDKIESEQFRKDNAKFNVGDSVRVHTIKYPLTQNHPLTWSRTGNPICGHSLNDMPLSVPECERRNRTASSQIRLPMYFR